MQLLEQPKLCREMLESRRCLTAVAAYSASLKHCHFPTDSWSGWRAQSGTDVVLSLAHVRSAVGETSGRPGLSCRLWRRLWRLLRAA